MRNTLILLSFLFIPFLLVGCDEVKNSQASSKPTNPYLNLLPGKFQKQTPRPGQIKDYSSVKPTNYQAQALNYIKKNIGSQLKDPYTAKYKTTNILEKEVCENEKHQKFRTWNTLVGINAKNSYGAYSGQKPYKVFFVNGKPAAYAYDILLGTDVTPLTCVNMK